MGWPPFSPGPILSQGKKLTGGKFRPVTPVQKMISLLFGVDKTAK